MKTIVVSVLCIMVPALLVSQSPSRERILVNPRLLNEKANFKVVDRNEGIVQKEVVIGQFRLNPEEQKAVVQTGTELTKIDKAMLPMLNNNSMTSVFLVPELYYAKVAGTDEQISYRIMFIDEAPLKYDVGKELFEGIIRFLPVEVKDSGNTGPSRKPLAVPEDIIVSYGSSSVPLTISTINWPPLDVKVTAADPKDSVEVKIVTVSNPLGYPKNLRVEPALLLSSTRTTFQGFGIQTVPLHVVLKGVSSYKPVPVTVETSKGSIDSASFTLTDDQPREVILRSEGIGQIDLNIVNPNYPSNSISIVALFPWLFLILAILGGLIGGLGKTLLGKEKVTLRPLALGSIIGLIAAVAYWGLGIVLIGFSVETRGLNEAMVLGFGLVAGFFGLKLTSKSS